MSGSNLKERIDAITKNSPIERLNAVRKLLITATACTAIAAPVAVGIFTSTQAHAQAHAPASDEGSSAAVSGQLMATGPAHSWRVVRGHGGLWIGPKPKMNKWSADRLSTAINGTWILDGNVHIEATFETVRQIHSPSRYISITDVTIDADRVVITPKPEGGSELLVEMGTVSYVVRRATN